MKVVITGGGTAGHIYPLIAIVREIKRIRKENDIQFIFVGPKDDFSQSLILKEGIEVKNILAGKIRRYFAFANFTDILFRLPIGFFQAFYYIFVISPDVIFSKGGYGSLPAVIAGWILSTPVFLHESDAAPGLANRIAGRLAKEIFTSYPVEKTASFPAGKMIYVGNPIRTGLFMRRTRDYVSLVGGRPIVLVIGGSQGAQFINERILSVLGDLLDSFEIIHQMGENNFVQMQKEADLMIDKEQKKYYHPYPFLNEDELSYSYNRAELIISRAGSGSIFEIAGMGKPSILVPLSGSAQNHQVKNAYAYAENGAAIVMEEINFTPRFLMERMKFLFNNPEKLTEMSKKANEFSKPEAAEIIAQYIVSYLTQ